MFWASQLASYGYRRWLCWASSILHTALQSPSWKSQGLAERKGYDGLRMSVSDGLHASRNKGNIYDIYEQDIPKIDMSTHLPRWKALLEAQIGRKLEADDFLFPYIVLNGLIHIKRVMSYSGLQALLTRFSQGAGVEKHYTTHCFWWGGAQYRFMFAPIRKRWSLSYKVVGRLGSWRTCTATKTTWNFCNNI